MWDTYEEMVRLLRKPGEEILESLTPMRVDAWHAATGVVTEAGELLDAIKKLVIYNKPLDNENVIEELGDLEFYQEQIRQCLGISREEVLTRNKHKLWRRYGENYSDRAAQERADKSPKS